MRDVAVAMLSLFFSQETLQKFLDRDRKYAIYTKSLI